MDVVRHGIVGSTVAESRLNLCRSCEHLGTRFGADSCNLCECLVSLKSEVPHESCPAHKWAEYDNRNWAVGMTTAPRRESTIRRALNGLRINGWEPTIFAEPGSDLEGIDAPIVRNETRLGCWLNFVREVTWLLDNTDKPMILTMQDDCELVPGARQLIDEFDWPDDAGFVSLWLPNRSALDYTTRPASKRPTGINPVPRQNFHGSLAVAWRRETLRRVVEHPISRGWLGTHSKGNRSHLVDMDDICIGRCVNDLGLRMYYAIPSASQHVAEYSARENQSRHKAKAKADWVAVNAWQDCQPKPNEPFHTAGSDMAGRRQPQPA